MIRSTRHPTAQGALLALRSPLPFLALLAGTVLLGVLGTGLSDILAALVGTRSNFVAITGPVVAAALGVLVLLLALGEIAGVDRPTGHTPFDIPASGRWMAAIALGLSLAVLGSLAVASRFVPSMGALWDTAQGAPSLSIFTPGLYLAQGVVSLGLALVFQLGFGGTAYPYIVGRRASLREAFSFDRALAASRPVQRLLLIGTLIVCVHLALLMTLVAPLLAPAAIGGLAVFLGWHYAAVRDLAAGTDAHGPQAV